ncbi:mechanosensitive ion channel domain-containing protein [Belliella pelovolcani]|uniref:Mechanosensitive ion channel n=1 Tax=Belliella pelovolcani TaxID=529505 RepID=A0A1N7N0R9_9BACT|nr:mechanosensitive ion channel domain-containing protein [Belliella pelovolcani]SIS91977.1 Mechanosensitive ion channel [Belliella pelovolcani]
MRIIFLFCFLLLLSFQGFAFQTDIEVLDTLLKVNEKLQEEEKPERPSLEGSIRKAQDFTIQLNRMNFNLNRELDTLSLMEDMPDIERLVNVIQSRLEDQDSKINIRYLNELDNLLRNIRVQVGDAERKVTARTEELIGAKSQLEDMKQSDLMKLDLRDSSILPEYQAALSQFRDRIAQTDSLLNGQRILTAAFQTRISRMMIKISELSIALDVERRSAEAALLRKDINFIWEKKSYEPNLNLSTVFWESIRLNEVILKRYIKNHIGMTIFLMLVFVGFSIWIKNLISKIRGEKEFAKIILERAHYVPKFPILSGVIILLPFIPFFYTNPTISFLTVLLWIAVLVVTVMLRSSFPSGLFRLWLMFVFIFFIYTVSNLYRDTNFSERWYLLFLSMIGIYLAVKIVRFKENNPELLPNLIDKLVKLYIGLQVFSILANIFGRFSLSKLLGVAATLSFAQAIGLYLFVQIVMEVIYLQIEVRRKSENDFTSYIDFHGIQTRVKRTLYGVASLIWVYYFLDNLSLLDLFIDQAGILLTTERSLFNTKFTYGNIVVFVVIVYVASLLANNIAYFATIKDQQQANLREKRLGSSILLIRLGVLSLGFLLAIGASGIGFEKIAIVLGALTLGISFGLQTIVNNLVSGVILAFEKPIQVGDNIEVGGRMGTVKDVGIRASKIQGYDGSEIIIPNGDLLSQHLINWTLSDKKRRVELLIGVSYGSDIDLVTDLISRQLALDEILKNPEPRVYLQNFADSAIEFRVLFWVENFDTWVLIRNAVMRGTFKSFKEHGVEIPFPQRDLNFKNFPAVLDEKVKSVEELNEIEKLKKLKEEEDKGDEKSQ